MLGALGAVRGPAEESTFRRAFALVSADALDAVLGAWLRTRAVRAGSRLVIAIDGKTVRGAKDKAGKAPHLVAALALAITNAALVGNLNAGDYNRRQLVSFMAACQLTTKSLNGAPWPLQATMP